jgi:hypothetical protein
MYELKNGMRGSSCPLHFLITEKLAHKDVGLDTIRGI